MCQTTLVTVNVHKKKVIEARVCFVSLQVTTADDEVISDTSQQSLK